MDYRMFNGTCYVRVDRGEEVVAQLLEVCRREGVTSATFSGIGGCQSAEIQVFDPECGEFRSEVLQGMLELVSFTGNVISDDAGELHYHAHALYAFEEDGQHRVRAGHLKSTVVLYTAEVELRPVTGGSIGFKRDAETGTGFWRF